MIRIVIENLLLFLLPTVMYVAYVYLTRGRNGGDEKSKRGVLDDAPLIWLFGAGAVLVMFVLIMFGNTSGGKPDQGYTPPSFEGGKVSPGQVR